ncbi:MAG: AAA family ATPase [Fuerstiella sp.]|nr:AAA family ATPase [Fuerstiella sp.]
MPETTENQPDDTAPSVGLESSTYEIIRSRLLTGGKELRSRLDQLNDARKQVFGSIDTTLLSTERITTAHNCIARDMVAIGNRVLLGYNVHFGLKSETDISDVFAVYNFNEANSPLSAAEPISAISADTTPTPAGAPGFERDFKELFRYYKNAVFAKFARRGPHLFMVFRVGKSVGEIKVFKWLIEGSGSGDDTGLRYVDNRSDHEFRFPPQHDFEWIRTTRDDHHYGSHPHVSIKDRVFVETVGGDLTIKIENNTASGEGIYAEPVADADQTLDDAEIYYAIIGNIILLKMRPYQEKEFRYILYNEKLQRAMRLDSIRDACVMLPDDHGLIFPNGYYLQDGEYKTFEHKLADMLFERTIMAPNGEDYLYIFYNRDSGTYVLLHYNLIEQKVDTPLICNGFTFFEAGELLCFKSQRDAQKRHAIQVWQTPYVGEDHVPHTQNDSFLNKIGNKDIVRGMAECHEVLNLINKEDTYANLYSDLVKQSGEIVNSHFWLNREDTFNLAETLGEVKAAASAAVDEFDKVVRVKKNTAAETSATVNRTKEILAQVKHRRFEHINDFVSSLSDLRAVRGNIISLRDLRYVDTNLIADLEQDVAEHTDRLSRTCVTFLLRPASLEPYEQKVRDEQAGIEHLTKVTDARALEEDIARSAAELEMLIEIVSNLKIEDATQRTAIIDNISGIFATVNQARAILKKKLRELASVEGIAEFNSQMKLLNQAVVNYLDICDDPEKCEQFLTKMMIQLEELEGRFAEFDEFILQLADKREEVYNAFENRKLALVEARNKRANSLMSAAERVLKGIQTRAQSFETVNDINGYFASDLMIEKVRDIVENLKELDDSVKVDDIQSRLKTIREDAVRQLKDRQELFVDGENTIRLGSHLFSVNTQVLDLTTVMHSDELCLHLTGTNFFEPIHDERLLTTRAVWDQEVVSENRSVYRGEYLAWKILQAVSCAGAPVQGETALAEPAAHGDDAAATPAMARLLEFSEAELLSFVQRFMGPRYGEAYTKGVHDVDAANILRALCGMHQTIGLLRFDTQSRALALLCWKIFADRKTKTTVASRMAGAGAIATVFREVAGRTGYVAELQELLAKVATGREGGESFSEGRLPGNQDETPKKTPDPVCRTAAEYLFCELSGDAAFAVSSVAVGLAKDFRRHLKSNGFTEAFDKSVEAVGKDKANCFVLLKNWVQAFLATKNDPVHDDYADEVAVSLMPTWPGKKRVIEAAVDAELTGIVGSHSVIDGGSYHLNYNRFTQRLTEFDATAVPRFNDYVALKHEAVEHAREAMRLDEFRPRVLTSFVRNKLLNEVYLPLIGDNLAKQIGVTGEGKRTDLMGLLLLVSPPGYGKTTLMEYIANRLGLIFMKINGPALGHHVTSLDPSEATNAGAREEVEKLNLALEMGDNVMIYLDDIQHTNPEFLQKFISLCDAQRKVEGVYKGRTRTYDLRGRKVSVVMAGNPYTESGEKFQIPDMLSNRADIYNLGEIIGESSDAFEMSYLENALTSNPVLAKLASRSQQDVYAIIRMANDEPRDGIELEGNYSLEEISELVSTMRKLMRVRDVILTVNREYIRSAAQSDDYRTEPSFKLQGSYRNMNRIAEKVVSIMNDDELTSLIVSNYENDAQTLTSGTEANLLKFKELTGLLTNVEAERWDDIKRTFRQNVKLKGISSDDRTGQVIATLGNLSDGLDAIRKAMTAGVSQLTDQRSEAQIEPVEDTGVAENEVLAQLITEELSGLKSGLADINASLSDGVKWGRESFSAPPTRIHEVETQKKTPSPVLPTVTPGDSLASDSPATTTGVDEQSQEALPHKITVVNKIPPTVVGVLKQQFKLMNAWMEPIHSATQAQRKETRKLAKQLQECMNQYEELINRIENQGD